MIKIVTWVVDGRWVWLLQVNGKVVRRHGKSRHDFSSGDFTYCPVKAPA